MATLAVMYLDLGLPAIVELTMNGIEAFTIVRDNPVDYVHNSILLKLSQLSIPLEREI